MILLVSSYGLQVSAANAHSASNHTCASLVLYHLSVSALNEERSVDLIDGFTSFLQMLRGKRIKDPTSWDRWSQKEIRTSSIWPEIRGLKSKQFPNWKFMNGLPMVLIPDTAHKNRQGIIGVVVPYLPAPRNGWIHPEILFGNFGMPGLGGFLSHEESRGHQRFQY